MSSSACCGRDKLRPDLEARVVRLQRKIRPNRPTRIELDFSQQGLNGAFTVPSSLGEGSSLLSTGEINRDDRLLSGGKWRTYRFTPSGSFVSVQTLASRDYYRRPATVVNPVRQDGSRAPSAYFCFWNRSSSTPTSFLCKQAQNYYGEFIDFTLLRDPDEAYGFAPWCKWGSLDQFPVGVENIARTKFRMKLKDADIQLGVILGEMRETVSMVAGGCDDLVRGLDRLARSVGKSRRVVVQFLVSMEKHRVRTTAVRGRASRVKKTERKRLNLSKWQMKVINGWLLVQFGIKPLLYDIDDARSVLTELLLNEPDALIYKVRAGHRDVSYRERSIALGVSPYPVLDHQGAAIETSCHIAATYSQPVLMGAAQRLGLDNLAAIGWELTRLSWIVDYITNVGAWLDQLMIPSQAFFKEGTISRLQKAYDAGRPQDWHSSSGARPTLSVSGTLPTLQFDIGRFERELLPSRGVDPAWFPAVRNRLNLTRLANILAVLTKLMR